MDFDSSTIKVLRYIKRHKDGVSIRAIKERFGIEANAFLIALFLREQLIVVMRSRDDAVSPQDPKDVLSHPEYMVYCAFRGRAILEERCFNFWKWTIPTIISVAALIVSVISAINKCPG